MAYNANIPQATDQLSQSQADLLANFQALQVLIDVNHVDFASADQGKHKWITWPVQGSAPSFNSGEIGAYSLLSSVTTINELYLNKLVSGSTAVQVPMTASILSTNAAPSNLSFGWTYLPSGILIKWDFNVMQTGQQTVPFRTGANIPVFQSCFLVVPFIASGGAGDVNEAVRLTSVNNTDFGVYCSPRTSTGPAAVTFAYVAIGY